MARKSKYFTTNAAALATKKVWKAGLYVRLSRDDGDKEESDSIANQRSLLEDYFDHEDDIVVHDVYVDDGFTGTNFERPDFQRMLDDLKNKSINCVAVKDLSRLGRNYIEVGNYVEKIFPFMDIRFISVNDSLDSVKNPQGMNNVSVAIKNILNDEFCRDISNKIHSSLDLKRKQGKFIGSFASYGYKKDPLDHNHLVIDEEAAAVVRDIFAWFIGGMSILGIAKKLNQLGVPNPTAYKCAAGLKYKHPTGEKNDHMWPDSSVRRILQNKIYTGCMVQGKKRIKSYKVQVPVTVPKDGWFVVPNTHEAIISDETFNKAQDLLKRDTRTAPSQGEVYLLAGFVKCADCGRAMNRKLISQPNKDYCYYICSTFKKMDQGACTKHTIRSDKIEKAILETLQKQIAVAVEMDALIAQINANAQTKRATMRLEAMMAEKEKEKTKVEKLKLELYPDWKNGDISKAEYQQLRAQYDVKIAVIEEAIDNLHAAIREAENGIDGTNAFLTAFTKYRNIRKLTREVIVELINMIYVHEGGNLTIRFNYADAFEQAAEYIEANKELTASA